MGQKNTLVGRLEIQSDGVSGSAGYENLGPTGSARLSSRATLSPEKRRDIDIETYTVGKKAVELTTTVGWDDADTTLADVYAAHQDNTHIGAKFLEDTTGEGFVADWYVEGWEWTQDENGTQTVDITFKPAYIDTAPAWI